MWYKMDEKEIIEDEEYKKRIKAVINKVEKEKDALVSLVELEIINIKEHLLEPEKSRIDPYFRSEGVIYVFYTTIRYFYKLKASKTLTGKDKLQEEIDILFKLIYEELKKPSPHIPLTKLKEYHEKIDKRRIVGEMTKLLGLENMNNDFFKKYNTKLVLKGNWTRNLCLLTVLFLGLVSFAIIFTTLMVKN